MIGEQPSEWSGCTYPSTSVRFWAPQPQQNFSFQPISTGAQACIYGLNGECIQVPDGFFIDPNTGTLPPIGGLTPEEEEEFLRRLSELGQVAAMLYLLSRATPRIDVRPQDQPRDDDDDECSQYRRIPAIFAFDDGTQISDYDLSFAVGIVYRGLASNENPSMGLFARQPGIRTVSPRSHNAGRQMSPWISSSKTAEKAHKFNSQGYGIAAIDLSRVDTIKVDLSQAIGLPARGHHRNAAIFDEEVLILDCVPRSAIIGWYVPPQPIQT